MATKRETPRAPGLRASAVIKWCAFGGGDPPAGAPASCRLTLEENHEVWGPPGANQEMWAWTASELTAHYEAHRAAVNDLARAAGWTRPWCLDAIDRERERERQVRCRNSSEPP